nr:hypothetical protein [Tanacetum cinerariifolium]
MNEILDLLFKNHTRSVPKEPSRSVPEEPSKSVPEEPSRSVPKEPSISVLEKPTRSVPKEPSRSVPEEPTRSVPKEPSRSVLEEPTRSVPKELSRSVNPCYYRSVITWCKTSHSQLVVKKLNSISAKSFCEEIRQLILFVDEVKFNHPILNLLLDEMVSDVDMLRPRVLDIMAA